MTTASVTKHYFFLLLITVGLVPNTIKSRLASDGYEIFNPPTSVSVVHDLKTQMRLLSKQVLELSQLSQQLEAHKACMDKFLERIHVLEGSMIETAKAKAESEESSESQKNIACLQKLSCDQVSICRRG